jgi:non-specific serine/threonine protein kinase/serine/threonine-protein kinase
VLVTVQDGKPAPKIIDFGVAKALGQHLTERTLYTEAGVLIGTPEYMSPEQADLTGHKVDTRTDVYSLGLILYELLTGVLPYDFKEMRRMGFDEILRAIREVEPPRPSARVGDKGGKVLERLLRGDLDWIAIKALEKEPARRYASPLELAADIGRHLRDEPVAASPPGLVYRTRKFARRHRFGASVAAVIFLLLVTFAVTVSIEARRIAQERDRANHEAAVSLRVKEFLTGLFQVSNPSEARGNSITAREILDRGAKRIDTELRDQPALQAEMMHTIGSVYGSLGLFGQAEPLLVRAIATRNRVLGEEHPDTLNSVSALSELYRKQGRWVEAEKLDRPALKILRRLWGPDRIETLQTMNHLGRDLGEIHTEESAAILSDAMERARRTLGADHQVTLHSIVALARTYGIQGRFNQAETLLREAVDGWRRTLGSDHPETLLAMTDLSLCLILENRLHEAEELASEALAIERRVLPPGHRDLFFTIQNLGLSYLRQHYRYPEAESLFREALSIANQVLDPNTTHICTPKENLADILALQGNFAAFERVIAEDERCLSADWLEKDEDLKPVYGNPRFDAIKMKVRRRAAAK